ncbi:hypothetical protein IEQ34_022493 [Dendrobium chrysotoxum]|uniref:DEK-C domain-containing protein n=1 Tax=Dendrobium chrysotoxum TaxID=161865 RepID=A0AAV7FZ07_DENCH|nr:hypothetical protein IEQ34_022493 [Dendrobium chrysotoxum]
MASPDQDASKDSAKNQSSAFGEEEGTPEGESTPVGEQLTQKKRGKKRKREEKEGKRKKAAQTATPLERPSRERKSVVRYSATASRSISATKALKIQQGPGEMLKDIPNVTFKLSKRKSDESLRLLHKILFGRKANVHFLKRNILQFSGFVWSQNEEKEKSKVREKLNKCNKERLLDFCDLLDVYTLKVTTKKEEISAKLLEFLESPHATREVLLSEKDTKGKKRRRVAKGTQERPLEEASSDKENTRPKNDKKHEAKKARKKLAKGYKEDQGKGGGSIDINDESEDKKDDAEETAEHSNSETEDENNGHKVPESTKTLSDGEKMDEDEEPKSKEKSPSVRKVSRAKSKKGSSSAASKKVGAEDEAKVSSESKTSKGGKSISKTEKKKSTTKKQSKDNSTGKAPQKKGEADSGSGLSHRSKKVKEKGKSNARTVSKDKPENKKQIEKAASKDVNENKKKITKNASKDMKENKKQIAKTPSKNVAKNKGKPVDDFDEPSTEQLHAVVGEILKEVDFNVATLADIIRQLGAHFNTDLMHRKTEIKGILEEVINNMSDDEDDEDDDDRDLKRFPRENFPLSCNGDLEHSSSFTYSTVSPISFLTASIIWL